MILIHLWLLVAVYHKLERYVLVLRLFVIIPSAMTHNIYLLKTSVTYEILRKTGVQYQESYELKLKLASRFRRLGLSWYYGKCKSY